MKLVHFEEYNGLKISISATFEDDCGIRLNSNSEWHMGVVYLFGEVKDGENITVKVFDTRYDYDIGYDDYQIEHKRKYKRVGFLKLKRDCLIIPIKEEYDRILPLFIQRMKTLADDYISIENRKTRNKKITDGLPESLSGL